MADKTIALKMRSVIYIIILSFLTHAGYAQKRIVVADDGSGDYKTIQGAINSLPDSGSNPRTIFIKKGNYKEKLYVEKANIIFEGESRDKTIITASIARDEWRCGHM